VFSLFRSTPTAPEVTVSVISFRRHTGSAHYEYDLLIDGEHAGYVWKIEGFGKTMWKAANLSGKITSNKESTRKAAVDSLARNVSDAYAVVETLEQIVVQEHVTEQDKAEALQETLSELATELVHLTTEPGMTAHKLAALRTRIEETSHELEMALLGQAESAPVERPQDLRRTKLRAANVSAFINSTSEMRTSSPEVQYRREGIFVRQSMDEVAVHVDINQPSHRQHLTELLVKHLEQRYGVRVHRDDDARLSIIYVTSKA
jgi:hypothetical protein